MIFYDLREYLHYKVCLTYLLNDLNMTEENIKKSCWPIFNILCYISTVIPSNEKLMYFRTVL